MDSKLKEIAKTLYRFCGLEKDRVSVPHADPRDLADFRMLEEMISHSLKNPGLLKAQGQIAPPLLSPKVESRAFLDETLMKKLLQYRDQIPVSSRIIRGTPESDPSS